MSLKFFNICLIIDNSLFSSEADFGHSRLSKAKSIVPTILGFLTNHALSFKYTVIVSKNGAPSAISIGSRNFDEVLNIVKGVQSVQSKFPILDCLSLASNICTSNALTVNHIIFLSSSPLFSESSISWSQIRDRVSSVNSSVTIISFCGEVYVLKSFVDGIGGKFICYSDEDRFLLPNNALELSGSTLMHCGLAKVNEPIGSQLTDNDASISHTESAKICPRCSWTQQNLPQECTCCGLMITLDVNDLLTKPIDKLSFVELIRTNFEQCFACKETLDLRYKCSRCNIQICQYCHEIISQKWMLCPKCV